jgi:hypothetical protein
MLNNNTTSIPEIIQVLEDEGNDEIPVTSIESSKNQLRTTSIDAVTQEPFEDNSDNINLDIEKHPTVFNDGLLSFIIKDPRDVSHDEDHESSMQKQTNKDLENQNIDPGQMLFGIVISPENSFTNGSKPSIASLPFEEVDIVTSANLNKKLPQVKTPTIDKEENNSFDEIKGHVSVMEVNDGQVGIEKETPTIHMVVDDTFDEIKGDNSMIETNDKDVTIEKHEERVNVETDTPTLDIVVDDSSNEIKGDGPVIETNDKDVTIEKHEERVNVETDTPPINIVLDNSYDQKVDAIQMNDKEINVEKQDKMLFKFEYSPAIDKEENCPSVEEEKNIKIEIEREKLAIEEEEGDKVPDIIQPVRSRKIVQPSQPKGEKKKSQKKSSNVNFPPLEKLDKKRLSGGFKSASYFQLPTGKSLKETAQRLGGSGDLWKGIRQKKVELPSESKDQFVRPKNLPGKTDVFHLRKVATGISNCIPIDKSYRNKLNESIQHLEMPAMHFLMSQTTFCILATFFSHQLDLIGFYNVIFLFCQVVVTLLIYILLLKSKVLYAIITTIVFGLSVNAGSASTFRIIVYSGQFLSIASYFICLNGQSDALWRIGLVLFVILGFLEMNIINPISPECGIGCYFNLKYLKEAILIFLVLLSLGFVIQRYVKINRYKILKMLNFQLSELVQLNLDLQHQYREAHIQIQAENSAPLPSAIQLLVSVSKENRIENGVKKEIDKIVETLNSDKLFQPEIVHDTGDKDVTNFLQDVLQTRKKALFTPSGHTRSDFVEPSPKQTTAVKILKVVELMGDPFFDTIHLESVSEGHSLYYLGVHIFQEENFQSSLEINERVFKQWLIKMENGYQRNNPYHNSIHAADVLHSVNYFLGIRKLKSAIKPEHHFAALVAAIGHDYMHPGVTNAFLVATKNPLALRYNDLSVLENFHAASVREIFMQPEYNLLADTKAEQQYDISALITAMILATDIGNHFELVSKFKAKISSNSLNLDNTNDLKLVLSIALKCADINNLTKPNAISRVWTQLIMDEFFIQGDQERERGLPISMFMDRNSTDIPKCQMVN